MSTPSTDLYAGEAVGGPLHGDRLEAVTGKYVHVGPGFAKGYYYFNGRYKAWIWEGWR